jgi:L-ascorbate metabolism protein UlaG (beta-lactamase superfamily)
MPRNRRKFLACLAAGTAAVGGAGWWIAASKQRAARWARRLIAEGRRPISPAPFKPQPLLWSPNSITVAWLGHSTVLLSFYGIRILTDPALGNHIGVSLGLGTIGPKRFVAPALKARELPPIDVVLLSHAHMDHMDLPTLRALRSSSLTVTANSTRDVLAGTGLKSLHELAWGDRTTFQSPHGELQIEAIEVKHWGQRWPSEKPRGYNGYVLRREGKAVLFAGDTASTPALKQIRSRGPFELALMPIGAYRPWIWNHCTPEEALSMANAAGAKYIVPIHHQTFRLSEEPNHEPIERLQAALAHEPERLALTHIGQTFTCRT